MPYEACYCWSFLKIYSVKLKGPNKRLKLIILIRLTSRCRSLASPIRPPRHRSSGRRSSGGTGQCSRHTELVHRSKSSPKNKKWIYQNQTTFLWETTNLTGSWSEHRNFHRALSFIFNRHCHFLTLSFWRSRFSARDQPDLAYQICVSSKAKCTNN